MPNIMASETLNFPKVTAWEEENDDIIPTCRRVKRLAVVDGCNVIHGCAGLNPYFEHKSKKQSRKPDAIGLLIVLKRLLEEDFEVRIFISMAYMSNTNCSNFFILEELIKLNYLFVVPPRVYDDVAILHCASKLGGFVVSNDKYREFKCIPMCYEATNRVIPFTFKRLDLQEIGGKQALNNPERKFWLGMDLHLALDQYKTVCTSDIREDPNFLMIYSRRRIRPKAARDQCLRTLTVIADFLQREFCFVHQMKPPPLAYFSQSALPPAKFSTFLDHYKTLRRTQNIFVI